MGKEQSVIDEIMSTFAVVAIICLVFYAVFKGLQVLFVALERLNDTIEKAYTRSRDESASKPTENVEMQPRRWEHLHDNQRV